MTGYIWIAAGSALGGMARYWLTLAVNALTGPDFPWGTILINVVGSFVIGLFGVITGPEGRFPVPAELRLFVMVGLCGGFTTFSSFSVQSLALIQAGELQAAALNIVLSVVVCIAACALGWWLGVLANRAT